MAKPIDQVAAASGSMPELLVEGFDAEQIWLQLDMTSAQLVRRAKRLLKKAGTEPSLLTPETEEDLTGQHTERDKYFPCQHSALFIPWHLCSNVIVNLCECRTIMLAVTL